MGRSFAIAAMVVGVTVMVTGATACGGGGARAPSRVAPSGPGDFPDNPQLAHVPADTAYAFATFLPVSPAYLERMRAALDPAVDKLRGARDPKTAAQLAVLQVLRDELGFDGAKLAQNGFDPKARAVVYGLGAYPVMRLEIADGDRVLAAAQRVTRRLGFPLPAPTPRGDRRYWILDIKPDAPAAVLVGLARRELVVAFAPRDRLERQLPAILGEVLPERALDTQAFRVVARRDGFTGQGVGFVDTARVVALAAASAGPGIDPPCRAAVDDIVRRVPRLAFGYDDVSRHQLSFGMVFELAPEVLAVLRTIKIKAPGLARLGQVRPVFAVAMAADIDQLRGLAPPFAAWIRGLAAQCGETLDHAADRIEQLGRQPLPAIFSGVRGAVVALTRLARSPQGVTTVEGFGVLRVDDPAPLLGMAASIPDFEPPELDGRSMPLPAALKLPGHVAARPDTVAVVLGPDSARAVEELLAEPAAPAPLFVMQYDYARLAEAAALFASTPDPDTELMMAMGGIGLTRFALDIDERGVVTSFVMELE